MARYPQGVSSFIPTYQAYQPDFTTMGKMLSIKQNQYDQNWKQLNKVYGSLYYADTTHEQSQVVKDQLKNEIDFNLKRISGLDLSLEQNVQAASQVFQPFYENSSLMYDMAATKNINSAKSKAGSYKNSANPESQEMYWDTGMDEINYRIKEFQDTPYDQIAGTGLAQVNYTPYFNVQKEALKLAKEFGNITTPSSDGMYDYTTTNGKQIQGYLENLFNLQLAQDPRVQSVYRTQAYVDRKNYMSSEASKYNGDQNAAERAYLEQSYKVLTGEALAREKKVKEYQKTIESQIKTASDPDKPVVDGQQQLVQSLQNQAQAQQANVNQATVDGDMSRNGTSTATTSSGTQDPFADISSLRRKVDYLKANASMRRDFNESAQLYSFRNYKRTSSVNKIYLENYKEELKRKTAAMAKEVEDGGKKYAKDKDGNIITVPIKSVSGFQQVVDDDISGGKTNMAKLSENALAGEFDYVQKYIQEGISYARDLKLAYAEGGVQDILNLRSGKEYKSLEEFEKNISSWEAFKESGLSYDDLVNVSSNIRHSLFDGAATDGSVDYSVLADTKYGIRSNARSQLNKWHNGAISFHNRATAMKDQKMWFAGAMKNIRQKYMAEGKGEGFAMNFAYDTNGNKVGDVQYVQNVADYVRNQTLNGIIKNEKLDAATEKDIRARAAKAWDRYDVTDLKFWTDGVGIGIPGDGDVEGYLSAIFNTYKLADGEWANYFGPWDWGKYNGAGNLYLKTVMPDYDDVIKFADVELSDSDNFKGTAPLLRGSGTGTSGLSAEAIVLAENGTTQRPYQEVFGADGIVKVSIMDDFKTNSDLKNLTYSAFGGSKKAIDEDENTEAHQEVVKALWDFARNEPSLEDVGNFRIKIKGGTQFDGAKAGYTLFFEDEFLEKYIQKMDSDGNLTNLGLAPAEVLKDIKLNGATILTDMRNLNSDSWENVSVDPVAARLKAKSLINMQKGIKDASSKVSFPMGNGYSIGFTYDPKNTGSNAYRMQYKYKFLDMNSESALRDYLNTGKTKTYMTDNTVSEESLETQMSNISDDLMTEGKQNVSNNMTIIKAVVDNLKASNPNVSVEEIIQALKKLNYGRNT